MLVDKQLIIYLCIGFKISYSSLEPKICMKNSDLSHYILAEEP